MAGEVGTLGSEDALLQNDYRGGALRRSIASRRGHPRTKKRKAKANPNPGAPVSFKSVQAGIAKKEGIPKANAGAILASASRNASPAAKKKNPKLLKVKGKAKAKSSSMAGGGGGPPKMSAVRQAYC